MAEYTQAQYELDITVDIAEHLAMERELQEDYESFSSSTSHMLNDWDL